MTGSACDLFLSYKAEDRSRLKPLVAALESDGFSVWWDARIAGGSNWRHEIEEHLDSARCVIVAWSKRSTAAEGEFVRDEARRARRVGTYLPIRIDAVEPPLGFGEIQALPLNGWKGRKDDPRYVALVEAVRAHLAGVAPRGRLAPADSAQVSRRAVVAGGGIAALSAVGGGAWLLLKPSAASAEGIAVMPFANLSGDQGQDWFSDGLAEELRTALSRVGLKVIGRASSEAVKSLDSKTAAARLHVGNILSGSVRRSTATIRVSAQLISGADGSEKWAQTYDRPPGDEIRIQSDIATNVAQALSVTIGQARAAIALGGTSDSEAEQLLLEARKLRRTDSSPESLTKVIGMADSAIARDPRYARAYVTKGEALSAMAASYTFGVEQVHAKFKLAQGAAEQALTITPQYGAAESLLSDIKGKMLDFVGALQSAETAVTLPADDPEMLWPAIRTLAYTTDLKRALDLTNRTMAIDPLSGRGFGIRAEVLLRSRQYPAAIAAGQRAIALAPKLFEARIYTAQSLILAGKNDAAKAVMAPIPSNYTFPRLISAITAARTGDRAAAEQTLHDMRMFDGDVSSYQYAQIHAQLGQHDMAVAALNKAFEVRDPGLIAVRVDAFLDPIRNHPRFDNLLGRLKLPGA